MNSELGSAGENFALRTAERIKNLDKLNGYHKPSETSSIVHSIAEDGLAVTKALRQTLEKKASNADIEFTISRLQKIPEWTKSLGQNFTRGLREELKGDLKLIISQLGDIAKSNPQYGSRLQSLIKILNNI